MVKTNVMLSEKVADQILKMIKVLKYIESEII